MLLAIQGSIRGLLAQILGLTGLLVGIWGGAEIRQWVGAHWLGAQPAVVFWALRWVVTLLAAFAIVSLFHVLAERVRQLTHDSPVGWVDRLGGVLIGACTGLAVASLLVVAVVLWSVPGWMKHAIRDARASRPLIEGGVAASHWVEPLPGGAALRRQYVLAARRLGRRTRAI